MRKFFEVFFTLALFCAKTSLREVQANLDAFDSVSNILSEVHSKRKVLSPPISMCLVCENSNLCVNNECDVVVYGLRGSYTATKVSMRCQSCGKIYNYGCYENEDPRNRRPKT